MITDRDLQMFNLMSKFGGKMFIEVLVQTLWLDKVNAKQQARNRLTKLRNEGYLLSKETGLVSPRTAFVLSEKGKDYVFNEFDKKISKISISASTTEHLMIEMVSYFWLNKLNKEPIRTTVSEWSKEHKHTPDIAYYKDDKVIYVEIERTVKSAGGYNNIFVNIIKDDVHRVLYIVENEKRVLQFARALPKSEKLMLVSIDEFVKNASELNKIGAKYQKEILNNE